MLTQRQWERTIRWMITCNRTETRSCGKDQAFLFGFPEINAAHAQGTAVSGTGEGEGFTRTSKSFVPRKKRLPFQLPPACQGTALQSNLVQFKYRNMTFLITLRFCTAPRAPGSQVFKLGLNDSAAYLLLQPACGRWWDILASIIA